MRIVTLVLLLLLQQEDPKIAEWVRLLESDSLEEREKALSDLVKAGRAAEKPLREVLKTGSAELKARAAQILAEIEKRERARAFDAGPSLITLKREKAPLKDVLEEMRKQARTPLTLSQATDDAGNSYAEEFGKRERDMARFGFESFGESDFLSRSLSASMDRVPAAEAKKLSILKGTLEIKLPEASEDFSFEDPAAKVREVRKSTLGSGSVQLLSLSRKGTKVTASVEILPAPLANRLRVRLADKGGVEYAFHSGHGHGEGTKMTLDWEFEVPEKAQIAALRCTAQTGSTTKKVPFEFRDIRIR